MTTKIQKWGNSQGLRISREQLEQARLAVGDEVEVQAGEGRLVVTPARRVRGRHRLADLVREIREDYRPGGEEWGDPTGRESW